MITRSEVHADGFMLGPGDGERASELMGSLHKFAHRVSSVVRSVIE